MKARRGVEDKVKFSLKKGTYRWLIWAILLGILARLGLMHYHCKEMGWFVIILMALSAGLVGGFFLLRDR